MKKILSITIALCLLLSVTMFNSGVSAAGNEFMIYDGETMNGVQDSTGGYGFPGDSDFDNFTQGEASQIYFTLNPEKLVFFYSYGTANDGATFSTTGYDYVEGDIYSHQAMEGEVSFRFVANNDHVGGTDYYHYRTGAVDTPVYFPEGHFVHFKFPLSDFIDINAPGNSPTRTEVYRIVFWIEDLTDDYGDAFPAETQLDISIDNITLTKNGAGSPNTLMTRAEWEDYINSVSSEVEPPVESSEIAPPVSSEVTPPVESSEIATPSYKLGDVNNDGTVTSADALMTLQCSVNKITLSEAQLLAAEVDGKEPTPSSVDALNILQYSVNKITVFPIEKA